MLCLSAKIVLQPDGLTVAAAEQVFKRKFLGLFHNFMIPITSFLGTITLIISNQEMEDIMKIIKSLGDLLKGIAKATDNETKHKVVDFLVCCLVT